MKKKDYELIASTLRAGSPFNGSSDYVRGTKDMWLQTIDNVVAALESENPKFDRDKFLTACGIETEVSQ